MPQLESVSLWWAGIFQCGMQVSQGRCILPDFCQGKINLTPSGRGLEANPEQLMSCNGQPALRVGLYALGLNIWH